MLAYASDSRSQVTFERCLIDLIAIALINIDGATNDWCVLDMRNVCFLAGVPELFSSFRNSLVGKSSRSESIDDAAVHWRIQSFLAGYNRMAQRYLPNYGTALRVARVSDDQVDTLHAGRCVVTPCTSVFVCRHREALSHTIARHAWSCCDKQPLT